MKKAAANLLLVGCSILFCLGIGEVGIRIAYPHLANYNLEMWRYFAEMKQRLPFEKLPFVHFPSKRGTFYGADIATNSMGFRGEECRVEKTPGKKRIVFVGDSQTLGWGVPFEQCMARRLERHLNEKSDAYEVINMGIGNYNSTMEVELFKLRGLALKPDIVFLFYFVNDAEPIPRLSWPAYQIERRSYLLAFLFDRYFEIRPLIDSTRNWKQYYASLYAPNASALAMNRQSLKEMGELCKANGIQLVVVNYPDLHEIENYPFPQITDYAREFAMEAGSPFIDLLSALKGFEPSSLWVSREDTHGNAVVNEVAARVLYDFLVAPH